MRWKSYRRLVRRLGLAIAIVAFAAPAAQAKPMTYRRRSAAVSTRTIFMPRCPTFRL